MAKPKASTKRSGHLAPAKKPPKRLVSQHARSEGKPPQAGKGSGQKRG